MANAKCLIALINIYFKSVDIVNSGQFVFGMLTIEFCGYCVHGPLFSVPV